MMGNYGALFIFVGFMRQGPAIPLSRRFLGSFWARAMDGWRVRGIQLRFAAAAGRGGCGGGHTHVLLDLVEGKKHKTAEFF
jgi:hypothetical protein